MSNKLFIIGFILMLFTGCKKNIRDHVNSHENSLEKNIFKVVDSMSLSFPKEYPVNLYTIAHQNKFGRDYIKISTSEFFNKDSVSTIKVNNKNIIIYYSKSFFKQKKSNLESYKNFEYTNQTISLYHPQYVIFEISKNNDKLKNIPLEKGIKMKLFDYSDRYIPEPAPSNR